ncbi:hypothetical protein SFRURICE_001886 [Spodoptera frugiperda]|nr:hypothetical protein SFRURICE_001886 [Spodoptera frugiperda]
MKSFDTDKLFPLQPLENLLRKKDHYEQTNSMMTSRAVVKSKVSIKYLVKGVWVLNKLLSSCGPPKEGYFNHFKVLMQP